MGSYWSAEDVDQAARGWVAKQEVVDATSISGLPPNFPPMVWVPMGKLLEACSEDKAFTATIWDEQASRTRIRGGTVMHLQIGEVTLFSNSLRGDIPPSRTYDLVAARAGRFSDKFKSMQCAMTYLSAAEAAKLILAVVPTA